MIIRLDLFEAIARDLLVKFARAARRDGVPPAGWCDYVATIEVCDAPVADPLSGGLAAEASSPFGVLTSSPLRHMLKPAGLKTSGVRVARLGG